MHIDFWKGNCWTFCQTKVKEYRRCFQNNNEVELLEIKEYHLKANGYHLQNFMSICNHGGISRILSPFSIRRSSPILNLSSREAMQKKRRYFCVKVGDGGCNSPYFWGVSASYFIWYDTVLKTISKLDNRAQLSNRRYVDTDMLPGSYPHRKYMVCMLGNII